jgi:rare lipoprotein A
VLSRVTEGPLERLLSPAARIIVAAALLFCATGCLHHHKRAAPSVHVTPPPAGQAAPIVQGEEGIASWYGHPYHGRQAASGEIYNMYDMTAAHKTLPFGTMVRVHDLDNGRDVTVRINDRGPFVEGRIIDLSYAAAQAMGMPGLAWVRLEILGVGSSSQPAVFAVQVGAFRDPTNADRLKALIEPSFGPVVIQSFDRGDGMFYRVRVGHEASEDAARDLAEKLRNANLATATFVVRMN